jgi:hypothetical protein
MPVKKPRGPILPPGSVMAIVAAIALSALAGGGVAIFSTDPRRSATHDQEAILREYLQVYCHPDKLRVAAQIGQAAVLSRLVIAAGVGELALAEYAKCKLRG